MSANVEQEEGEMVGVDPVITERVAAELGGRNKAPVGDEGFGKRWRQYRLDIVCRVLQFSIEPAVRPQQVLARFGERAIGSFKLFDKPGLALAEQGHVVGLLLHEPRFAVFGRDVQQENPDAVAVGEEVDIGHAPGRHFHGPDQERSFSQGQQAFEKVHLAAGGLEELELHQAVVFEVTARPDQDQRMIH